MLSTKPQRTRTSVTRLNRIFSDNSPVLLRLVALTSIAFILSWLTDSVLSSVRPRDFMVYRLASQAAYAGFDIYSLTPYSSESIVSGMPFTYPPFAALILWPTHFFSWHTSYLIWSVCSLLCLAYVFHLYLPKKISQRNRTLVLCALITVSALSSVLSHHLSYGQINLFLMALCLIDACLLNPNRKPNSPNKKYLPQGTLIGIAAGIKLTPLLFIPFFLLTKQYKTAAWTTTSFLTTQLLAHLFFPTISTTFYTNTLWHLSSKVDLGGGFASSGNHSIQGAVAALGTWANHLQLPLTAIVALIGLYCAKTTFTKQGLPAAAIVVGLTTTMVSPISWIHHWVYLFPALLYLWINGTKQTRIFVTISALFILVGGHSVGDKILFHNENPWLYPIGFVLRESILIIYFALILLFTNLNATTKTLVKTKNT